MTTHTRVRKREADRQTDRPRIYFADGTALVFAQGEDVLALNTYFRLPKGVRAAYRGAGDTQELFEWSYVDRL